MRDSLDGGGRFIPADIVGVHTLSFLMSSRVAHDGATDIYTQHSTQTKILRTPNQVSKTSKCKTVTDGDSTLPRQGGIQSVPL